MTMFKKVAQFIDYVIERVSFLFLVFSGAMIVLMAWLTTYGVTRRYFFRNPEPYSYELATIFLLACTILTIAYTQKLGRNIRVDFVANHLPERVQAILFNIVGPVIGLFFCAIFTWKSWGFAMYALKTEMASMSLWGEPLFPVTLIVPIGAGLLSLVLIAQICRWLTSIKKAGS
jgi:TRAP-type C4-dicarboxylate transport system permease small subunit